jgi:ELWxxDGT repeat protein
MTFVAWFGRWSLRGSRAVGGGKRRRSPSALPPHLEVLESRLLPSLTPHLLRDINPGSGSSNPSGFVEVKGTAFFAATDPVHGTELWKSNGTPAGTVLVRDIHPGSSGGVPYASNPSLLTNVNGTLFFEANDGTRGTELWKSNGTAAGTVLVRDIWVGGVGNYAASLTNVNGTLFLSANDGPHGSELWKSNGTPAGTVMVKDIKPGAYGSNPSYLTNVNGVLYFQANDGVHGAELWKSNGTPAGTTMVKDIAPGMQPSSPRFLINVNGVVFFQASDGVHGAELWKSNGTPAGTTNFKDIRPGILGSYPSHLTNNNGHLSFAANDGVHGVEPWITNGTPAGTHLLKDINPGSGNSTPQISPQAGATIVNGTAFFLANNGTNGFELWKSNGTAAGTLMVKDIRPGSANSYPLFLTNVNGTLFFQANNGVSGVELWMSNGAAPGTLLIRDIDPGSASSNPSGLLNVNGTLFFSANDGVHGVEPWVMGPVPLGAGAFAPSDGAMSPSSVDAALVSAPQGLHTNGSPASSAGSGLMATSVARFVATDGDSGSSTKAGVSDGPVHSARIHTPTPPNDNLGGASPWRDDL